jgi:phenylalanyl-tRNA synthetase alpha chain
MSNDMLHTASELDESTQKKASEGSIISNTDVETLRGNVPVGSIHPITQVINEIHSIFAKMGFMVAEGPQIETEFYNFDALRTPKDHPSRDMQDTFWMRDVGLKGEKLVPRTHTSGVQVRYTESHKPPFKIIVPGKVFRNEATDATHEAEFFQIEGMMVAKKEEEVFYCYFIILESNKPARSLIYFILFFNSNKQQQQQHNIPTCC